MIGLAGVNYSASKNISFGSYRCTTQANFDNFRPVTVQNYTELFRDENLFEFIPEYLNKRYPEGVQILNYACSDGSEPFSLVLRLKNDLKDADKFLPIKAFDISNGAINRADQGLLNLNQYEFEKLNRLKNIDQEQYIEKIPVPVGVNANCRVTKEMHSNVEFKVSDIFQDLRNSSMFDKPAVLLYRNASQFYGSHDNSRLADGLFMKLKPNSSIVIGDYDIKGDGYHSGIGFYLARAGFSELDFDGPKQYIFEKN